MQQATAHIVCYPFLHCRSVICIHLSQKSIFGSEKRHSSPSFTGNDNCPFQIESYVPLASAADCSHAVCCTFLHCTSVVCITCMPWRHSPALTHSLTTHGLTTDDLGRGSEHPTAEGRDRLFYSVSVTTIRWYARANEVSGVFPHMKTCLLCTNVTTRDTLTILNPSSVMIPKIRSLALVL